MNARQNTLQRIRLSLVRITRSAIAALSVAFVVIILYGVVSRYVFNIAVAWVEELAVFMMAWLTFLGISIAAYEKSHIGMYAIQQKFPPKFRGYSMVFINLLIILFLLIVVYQGAKMSLSVIPQISPALRVSYVWPYLSLPVGASLMIIQVVFVVIDDIISTNRGPTNLGELQAGFASQSEDMR